MPVTPCVFCAVSAVMTEAPYTPSAEKVFRSAWMPAPPPESEPAMVTAIAVMARSEVWREFSACRPRLQRCETMTLRCRPRAGGDPYAAARRCGRASDNRNLGGYGSPRSRGRQRLVSCQGHLGSLGSRFCGNDRKETGDDRRGFRVAAIALAALAYLLPAPATAAEELRVG